jgi:hypothetical protein
LASASNDLGTIRRLSQYRPFERGGASARETKEDLVLAALAEGGGSCASINDCASDIAVLWGLQYDALELGDPIGHLIANGQLLRGNDGGLTLSSAEFTRLKALAKASQETAAEALAQWHAEILGRWPATSTEEFKTFDLVLERFLHAMIMQHGAEAALLMFPEDPAVDAVLAAPDAKADALQGLQPREFCDKAEWALSRFMREATEAQRTYLSEMLNTSYFVSSLTLDPECGRLIKELTAGQRVYLDTNFVYRLLGVQGPRYVKAAEVILRATQAAGYVCAVTPWTVEEYRRSLERSQQYLQRYPIPPDEFADLAADVASVEDFVTSYWRQVRASQLSVTDYVAYHQEVESHLTQRGIAIVDEGIKAIDAQKDQVATEVAILNRVLAGKQKHPELLVHDAKHRLLVKRLRGAGNRSFANAGYWFLTHDRVLPRYDAMATREEPSAGTRLPFCVSAGAWFQVVEAFRPKTQDFAQTLSDVIASPYIHPRATISKQAAQAVVARVALYKGGDVALAARVFMNSVAMAEIEAAAENDQRTELIDNALIAAAREIQEEAQRAREEADAERLASRREVEVAHAQLEKQKQDAADRLALAESIASQKAESEAARRAEEHRAELHRREESHRSELHRHQQTAADELQSTQTQLSQERLRSARLQRFVRLAGITLAAGVLFVAAVIVFGFSHAWEYAVAAGVSIGLIAAADQLLPSSTPPD